MAGRKKNTRLEPEYGTKQIKSFPRECYKELSKIAKEIRANYERDKL
jgi:hypothetical protein